MKNIACTIVIFILLASIVMALGEGTGGQGDQKTPEEQSAAMRNQVKANGGTIDDKATGSYDETTKQTKITYATYYKDPAGNEYHNLKNAIINADGTISYESIGLPNGAASTNGEGLTASSGGYKISSVGSLQQGPIVITNGKNVKYENGCLSADSADSLVETDTVATKIDELNYCEKTIDVKEADSVWAGCVFMEGVEDSKITAGTDVAIESESGSEFTIKDCAAHTYDYKALSDDSSLIISKSTLDSTLELTDVQIELEKDNVTERVETNGTAKVEVSRIDGIQKVQMSPVTIYTYDADDPEQDLAIRAWQTEHTIYLRKTLQDQLPAEVSTCTACSIFDLPNHALEVRGVIDINKNQLGKTSHSMAPFFTTGNVNAKAILSFDNNNAFIKEVLILNDAPPYKTIVSNYLTIEEAIQRGTTTERLLTINEDVPKAGLTQSLVQSYRTVYSPATMKIANNEVTYQKSGVNVFVLPDGNEKIADLLKAILHVRSLVFLGVAGIVAGLFMKKQNRKGQLTMFMIIGIVILAVVGVMLFLVGTLTIPKVVHVSDKQQVQDFVSECLRMSARDSLMAFGIQGTHLALQEPFHKYPNTALLFDQGTNNQLPLDRIELDIAEDTKTRFKTCADFTALKGVTVNVVGSPTIRTILGSKDSTFTLDYQFFVNKGEDRWDFKDFATSIPIPTLHYLDAVNATVNSQLQNEERINLDQLPLATYTFFPEKGDLMALIEGTEYQVLFANRRQ